MKKEHTPFPHQPRKLRISRFQQVFQIVGILFIAINIGWAQENFTQTIKGKVTDADSHSAIPGATVLLLESDPLVGAVTDLEGFFKLENIPVGRQSLKITFVGYEPVSLHNLNLTTGKELYLDIELTESIVRLDEIVVTASDNKEEVNNEMALTSARTFSIEESDRFAGAMGDVARMASNYAGVSTANDNVNDIVIRGNSADGLLWKLEGISIPNPNHFGFYGSTGGPVSMLNTNVLANSDFFTGAFPAEYGNGLSGVFDLKMRHGNTEKHEFIGQIGFNGFELGAEGPLKPKGSSFIVNYRYSVLGLIALMGLDMGTGTAVPYYQDLTLKVDIPTKKQGKISLFGLGGLSKIDLLESNKDSMDMTEDFYGYNSLDIYNKNNMGVLGLAYSKLIHNDQYMKITLAGTTTENSNYIDSIGTNNEIIPFTENKLKFTNFIVDMMTNKKYSARFSAQYGINYKRMKYDFYDTLFVRTTLSSLTSSGATDHFQAYAQGKYRLSEKVTSTAGVYARLLGINKNVSVEPRAGLQYKFSDKQSFSLGYGLHSLLSPLFLLTSTVTGQDNRLYQPNIDLGYMKSHHFVVGLDHRFSPTLRLKTEAYYQYIYDGVVEQKKSSYSALNNSSMNFSMPDSLSNEGSGKNMGVDITFEKFMDKGAYFLTTLSLFDSKYTGSDGIWRSTAFDGGHVFNGLGGKEFALGSKKKEVKSKKWLLIDGKVAWSGGRRYTPVDLEASKRANETVYKTDEAFSIKMDDYFRLDLRVAFRQDSKRISQEWALNVQNVTNRKNPLFMRYNIITQKEEVSYQLGLFPMMQYRIYF